MSRFCVVTLACLFLAGAASAAEGPSKPEKLLIEFGWDEPDTPYLRAYAEKMAELPFDGCVFHASGRAKVGGESSLCWKFWGKAALDSAEFRVAEEDLEAIAARPSRHFRQHFLRVNTTPGDVDWFDDFTPIVANSRLAARLARMGGCRGILFDTEAYEKHLFRYSDQPGVKTHSWDDYAGQARRRGREIMEAFQAEFPGLTVLITFGPSLVERETKGGKVARKDTESALLEPFVAGLVEARRDGSTVIDGHEMSYGYREPEKFDRAFESIRRACPEIQAGFGLWLDHDWRKHGWNEADPGKNYFTPETFATSVKAALARSDGIVWIYTETPRWWGPDGKPVKLPAAYIDALRRAAARTGD